MQGDAPVTPRITTDDVRHNDELKPVQRDLMIHPYGRKLCNAISQHISPL
jgi:hypothetical protein